jgi:hypothetical protein
MRAGRMGFSFIRKTASTASSATGALVAANSLQPCETMKGQKQSSKEDSRRGPPSRTLNQQWVVTKRNGRNKDFLLGQYIQRYFFVFIPYTENTCVNPLIPSTMTQ